MNSTGAGSPHWAAPFRGKVPVDLTLSIPGSKSVTNRALILAALADSPTVLHKALHSRDTDLMIAGLQAMGVGVSEDRSALAITPGKLSGPATIDVGNAGTVMRFLPPVAALANGAITFDGDARSHERPIGPVIAALEALGVKIDHENRYSLPMSVHGTGAITGGEIAIDASASSQFLSALLLIGSNTKNGITISHTGGSLPSMPHIEMTIAMVRDFGGEITVDQKAQTWHVAPRKLHGMELTIEPDLSNAAPFLSIAMAVGGSVTIKDWPSSTTQPGGELPAILERMGAKTSLGKDGLTLTSNGLIHGIDIDLHNLGELTPAIAALAALAASPSRITGIGHLRLHETDRLAALTSEINGLGGKVKESPDSLEFTPAPLHKGIFHTYEDHRLATAGAVIGLVVSDVEVENIDTTKKTLPNFAQMWSDLLR